MASISRIGFCFEKFRHFNNVSACRYRLAYRQSNGSYLHTTSKCFVVELKMPSLSPTMSEGTIVKWQKKEGESINAGDILCEIQTDKAVMSLETEEEGTLAKILLGDDSKDVKVGTLIALLAEPGEDWKAVQNKGPTSSAADKPSVPISPPATPVQAATSSSIQHATKPPAALGPAVRALLHQYGLDSPNIPASGPHGMLLKGDVLNYIKTANLKPIPVTPPPVPSQTAKPAVSEKPAAAAPKPATKKVTNLDNEQEFRDLELSNMRRTIAKRLTQSKTGIPHAYSTVDCKVDGVLALRKKFKADGVNFSVNDILIKAVGMALQLCPEVNVVWKGDELVQAPSIDISVAVATDNGLITPIVTDVPGRGLQDIGEKVRDLANRARMGKLQLHEFQGGSFTISNLGMFGISEFSAIINPPQCGILAVGGSRLALGDDGKPTTVMSATLSYDEGAVDSSAAAQFMATLRDLLEAPQSLMLGRPIRSLVVEAEC